MRQSHKKRRSAIVTIAGFLMGVLIVQSVLFLGLILFGGTIEQLRINAVESLSKSTENRKNYLESQMVETWGNLGLAQVVISETIKTYLEEHSITPGDLQMNDPLTEELLEKLSPELINLIRTNKVTGSFIIFTRHAMENRDATGKPLAYQPGVHFRDMDPTHNPPGDENDDILLERGPVDLLRNLGVTADISWRPGYSLLAPDSAYYNPLRAAQEHPGLNVRDMGYWTPLDLLPGDSSWVTTYTHPLLDENGEAYGLLGVEIMTEYIHTLMPSQELNEAQQGSYILAVSAAENEGNDVHGYQVVALSGPKASQVFSVGDIFRLTKEPDYKNIYRFDSRRVEGVHYASLHEFTLYNPDFPMEGDTWVLLGVMDETTLFDVANGTVRNLLVLVAIGLVCGLGLSIWAGHRFARPFVQLTKEVQQLDPTKAVQLTRTNVEEVDNLAWTVERLSRDVAASAGRLSQVIRIADLSMAVFRFDVKVQERVDYTDNLMRLFGQPEPLHPLTNAQFKAFLRTMDKYIDEKTEDTALYHINAGQPDERWLRCKASWDGDTIMGVLMDVTRTVKRRKRLEYERDYDLLTNLLNRRAFQHQLEELSRREDLGVAVMVMIDLDDVKYVNDTYGHDSGDAYICCMADVMRTLPQKNRVASRISGDEFYLFLYGRSSREELLEELNEFERKVDAATVALPGKPHYRLRASMGAAWYPDDSMDLFTLRRYADFAMYEIKHGQKGTSHSFNRQSYERNAYLRFSSGELNRILEEQALDYMFQPIVRLSDGHVVAYEALMRPRSEVLRSPLDFLRIARAQSKLGEVDDLTWRLSATIFFKQYNPPEDTMLFINSIPTYLTSSDKYKQFGKDFRPYLNRIVMELTESDEMDNDVLRRRQQIFERAGIRTALDDFGTGYSNDSALLNIRPSFVKVDMSLIQDIDSDEHKMTMVSNLIQLCHDMGAQVIAEGIETAEELKTLIRLGADFGQGYLLARPAFQLTWPEEGVCNLIEATYQEVHSEEHEGE